VVTTDARQPKPRPVPERYFNGRRLIHICFDKEGLVRAIQERGPRAAGMVSNSGQAISKAEAVAWVREHPCTDVIPDQSCDDFDPTGRCNGHPTEESDPSPRPAHLLPPDPDFPTSIRARAPEASTGAAEPVAQGSPNP
jgi:hypothetical protein